MRRNYILLLLLWILVFTAAANSRTVDVTRIVRPRSGIDIKVTELLVMAMQARDAGDLNSAELLWIQAMANKPSLKRPAWLDQQPEMRADFIPPAQPEMLARIASMPYQHAKPLLEERLARDPGNDALRQAYLDIAEKNSDHTEVNRHRSVLQTRSTGMLAAISYLLAAFLLVVLIWQLVKLYRDLRAT